MTSTRNVTKHNIDETKMTINNISQSDHPYIICPGIQMSWGNRTPQIINTKYKQYNKIMLDPPSHIGSQSKPKIRHFIYKDISIKKLN
jgi:hypothetical protein